MGKRRTTRKRRTAYVYPPPFGEEEDCICPDWWRKTRPRNHTDKCMAAYEQQRQARRVPGESA